MTYEDRLYHVNRISFCRTAFQYRGKSYYVGYPTPLQRFRGESLYREVLNNCQCWSEQDRLSYLASIWYWGKKDDEKIEELKETIDNLKVDLFKSGFKVNLAEKIRTEITNKIAEIKVLQDKRSLFEDTTNENVANQSKFKYVVACSIKKEDDSYYFKKDPLLSRNTPIINEAISSILRDSIGEDSIREIARTEPWASIWASSEKCSALFGNIATELLDEQKILIYWSQLYDNIRMNADLPEDVIIDDWKLDGFLIDKRRQRERDKLKAQVSKKISPKVAQGDMIFVTADSEEEMRVIDDLNDAGGRMMKAQLQNEIYKKGELRYQDSQLGKEKLIQTINEARKNK